jgi:hypothetical protein
MINRKLMLLSLEPQRKEVFLSLHVRCLRFENHGIKFKQAVHNL